MKKLLKPIVIAAAGCTAFAGLSSCSKEARQEAAAESAVETSVDAMEDYCKLLESIKDKETAKEAIGKMDGLGDKFAKIAEKAKKAGDTPPDQATIDKTQAQMKPLQERMTKAMTSAMPIITADPELMKAFQEKSVMIGQKMQEASSK